MLGLLGTLGLGIESSDETNNISLESSGLLLGKGSDVLDGLGPLDTDPPAEGFGDCATELGFWLGVGLLATGDSCFESSGLAEGDGLGKTSIFS